MTKNVFVTDEQGISYGTTYMKRAKGLVKNGRARFVNDNTICLACPPNQYLEDAEMIDKVKKTFKSAENLGDSFPDPIDFEETIAPEADLPKFSETISPKPDCNTDFLSRETLIRLIAGVHDNLQPLNDVIDKIATLGESDAIYRIKDVFMDREATDHQLLSIYSKQLDNVTPRSPKDHILDAITQDHVLTSCVKMMSERTDDMESLSNAVRSMYETYEKTRCYAIDKLSEN